VLSRKRQDETPATGERESPAAGAPDRFERRRADIIAAAIPVLNGHGFKGMRLTAVAELIGLRATGVTYYFPRKEELAVACLESGYAVFDELLDEAEKAPDGASRIARLIELFVARDAAVRRGEAIPLSSFAAIRALEGEHRERVVQGYKRMFRRVRALFESPELDHIDRVGRTVRALVLLEQLFWANVWLGDYDLDHFPRLAQRMTDIVVTGLIPPGASPALGDLDLQSGVEPADAAKESFLMAASRQINEHGYRGASVDRISAALNVTKGAFYHYNATKDDLVVACFQRTFDVLWRAIDAAEAAGGEGLEVIHSLLHAVVQLQVGPAPLLRTSALSTVPEDIQADLMFRLRQISIRLGSMLCDGIADGSVRPLDASITAQILTAGINAASELAWWQPGEKPEVGAHLFVDAMVRGVIHP